MVFVFVGDVAEVKRIGGCLADGPKGAMRRRAIEAEVWKERRKVAIQLQVEFADEGRSGDLIFRRGD